TPALALPAALAGRAMVTVAPGCRTWTAVPEPAAGSIRDPQTGEPGLRLEFRDGGGALIGHEHRTSTELVWWGEGLPPGVGWGQDGTIVLLTRLRASITGPHLIGAAGVGRLTLTVDGTVAADAVTPVPADPVQTMTRPGEVRATADLRAGQEAEIRLDFRPADGVNAPLAIRLGIAVDEDEDAMMAEAVRAAARAGAAVVVVGSAGAAESEGVDREDPAPPRGPGEPVAPVGEGNPETRGGGDGRDAGPHALGGRCRGGRLRLAARPGHGRRPGRRPAGPGGAGGAAARHPARPRVRLPGPARRSPRWPHRLRRRPAHRLPRLRRGRHHPDVRVRPWARLHPVGLRVRVAGRARPGPRPGRPGPGDGAQHRTAARPRDRPGLRGQPGGRGGAAGPVARGLRRGERGARRAGGGGAHGAGPGLRRLGSGRGRLGLAAGPLHGRGGQVLAGP